MATDPKDHPLHQVPEELPRPPGDLPPAESPPPPPHPSEPGRQKPVPTSHSQYGLKDESGTLGETYANRPGGEQPGHGPTDTVDPSAHRQGAVEERPDPKPASRQGTALTGESDDKKR